MVQKKRQTIQKIVEQQVAKIAKKNLSPVVIKNSTAMISLAFVIYLSAKKNPSIGNIKAADEIKDVIKAADALVKKIYSMNSKIRKDIIIPEEELSLFGVAQSVQRIIALVRNKELALRQKKTPPGRFLGNEKPLVELILKQYEILSGLKPTLSVRIDKETEQQYASGSAYDFIKALYCAFRIEKNPEAAIKAIIYPKSKKIPKVEGI